MYHIKQRDRFFGLVRLQLANEMELNAWMPFLQRWPFTGGLLNTVFTEQPLPRENDWRDVLHRPRFRHGDQVDVLRRTLRQFGSGAHARADGRQTVGGCFWCRFLHSASL